MKDLVFQFKSRLQSDSPETDDVKDVTVAVQRWRLKYVKLSEEKYITRQTPRLKLYHLAYRQVSF